MKIRTSIFAASFALGSLCLSLTASAQDVFSTGQTSRDYNYIQLAYLVNKRNFEQPILLNAQVSLNQNFSFLAEYVNLDETKQTVFDNDVVADAEFTSTIMRAGIGFHVPSKRWSRIDYYSELLFEQFKSKANVIATQTATFLPGNGAEPQTTTVAVETSSKTESNSLVARLGFRGSITSALEVQAAISTAYTDKEFYNEQLNLHAIYRVTKHLDVALGALDATDNPNYNFGFRYNW